MITASQGANVTLKLLEHGAHVAKPHHVAGYGTGGGFAMALVILNGYSFGLITLICLVLNLITIPIMLQRDIIIPSYIVLTAITLSDMFMALSSLPFNTYFYVLDGYKSFVPFDLCFAQRTFGEVVPAALHTMSIWCTVYLAVHRYREVTTTTTNKRKMSLSGGSASRRDFITVVVHIALVAFFSFFIQCFRFFDTEVIPVRVVSPKIEGNIIYANVTETAPFVSCSMRLKGFITSTIGKNAYFLTFLWCRTICVQILPCTILIFVNVLLIRVLNERIEVRKNLLNPKQSSDQALIKKQPSSGNTTSSPAGGVIQQSSQMRDPNRSNLALRNWRLITRMLWLIVLITLIVELPFAIWFIYLCIDITAFQFRLPSYVINIVSSSLNVLLLLTTPLKFIIYFTMIRPFRDKLNSLRSGIAMRLLKHSNRLHESKLASHALVAHEPTSTAAINEQRQEFQDRLAIQTSELKLPASLNNSINASTDSSFKTKGSVKFSDDKDDDKAPIVELLELQSIVKVKTQEEMLSILVRQQTPMPSPAKTTAENCHYTKNNSNKHDSKIAIANDTDDENIDHTIRDCKDVGSAIYV